MALIPDENIFAVVMHELGFLDMQINEITKTFGANIISALNKDPFVLVRALPQLHLRMLIRSATAYTLNLPKNSGSLRYRLLSW